MKDLSKTKFCLGLQVKHISNGILIYQLAYTEKVLKHFHMDKAHPLSSPRVVRSLDVKQIRSSDNLADLFTKSLPTATFKKILYNIGMRRLKDLHTHEGE